MTREETAEAIKVMQAWCDGKTIELCDDQLPEWQVLILNSPNWQFGSGVRYRIKPEPTLVPWSKPEDVPMNCWVCCKTTDGGIRVGSGCLVLSKDDVGVLICAVQSCHPVVRSYQMLFDEFLFSIDGKEWNQCGKVA